MRFLANENFPLIAVQALRRSGHDTGWVRVEAPGSPDDAVLARALGEQRVLLTFDKDFGALVFRSGTRASCGVVLFRMRPIEPDALARWVVSALDGRSDWSGHFAVIEAARVRVRRLPAGQER